MLANPQRKKKCPWNTRVCLWEAVLCGVSSHTSEVTHRKHPGLWWRVGEGQDVPLKWLVSALACSIKCSCKLLGVALGCLHCLGPWWRGISHRHTWESHLNPPPQPVPGRKEEGDTGQRLKDWLPHQGAFQMKVGWRFHVCLGAHGFASGSGEHCSC